MLADHVSQAFNGLRFPKIGLVKTAHAIRDSPGHKRSGRRRLPRMLPLKVVGQHVMKLLRQIFRIRIVLPLHQVHRLAVRAKIAMAPNEIGDGFGHLVIREAKPKASAGINLYQLLVFVVEINLAGGGRRDQHQRFRGWIAGKLVQFPREITGPVAGAPADNRQRGRNPLRQGSDPLARTEITRELVPAKP